MKSKHVVDRKASEKYSGTDGRELGEEKQREEMESFCKRGEEEEAKKEVREGEGAREGGGDWNKPAYSTRR